MNLIQRKQIVSMVLEDATGRGVKIKEGAKEALTAVAVWAGNKEHEFCDRIDSEMKKWIIPEGITMPWGTVVKP
jgi:hypothetical protein